MKHCAIGGCVQRIVAVEALSPAVIAGGTYPESMPRKPMSLLPDRMDLPRGRSALPESEVVAAQRARIMQASVDEVAAEGYAAATVAAICRRARVSRTTFYRTFADKEEAFAAAHLAASDRLVAAIRARAADLPDHRWRERIRLGVDHYVAAYETSPAFAYSFLVGVMAVSHELSEQRDRIVERHARGLVRVAETAHAVGAAVRIPGSDEAIAVIGAADALASRQVRAVGRGDRPELAVIVEPLVRLQSAVLEV